VFVTCCWLQLYLITFGTQKLYQTNTFYVSAVFIASKEADFVVGITKVSFTKRYSYSVQNYTFKKEMKGR